MSGFGDYGIKLKIGIFRPHSRDRTLTWRQRLAWRLRSLADHLDGEASYGVTLYSNIQIPAEAWSETVKFGVNGMYTHLGNLLLDEALVATHDDGLDNRRKSDNHQ